MEEFKQVLEEINNILLNDIDIHPNSPIHLRLQKVLKNNYSSHYDLSFTDDSPVIKHFQEDYSRPEIDEHGPTIRHFKDD